MFDKAQDFITSNDSKTREILAKNFNLKPEITSNMSYIKWSKNSELDPQNLQIYTDFLFSLGEIKEKVNVRDLVYKI